MPITRVWQRLEAVNLPKEVAGALNTTTEAPAFCLRQLIYSADNPISYVDYFLKSDVFAFEDSFEPGRAPAGGWFGSGRFPWKP
jgi:GntR family transcriptional regulator